MARVYVFADEAGNMDFKRGHGASRYWILGTVTLRDLSVGGELLDLRRELAWQGTNLESTFHAAEDVQVVRDEVFRLLQAATFRVDATVIEKRKTLPRLQRDHERFYKLVWFLHFKYVAKGIARSSDELLVVAASLGTKKRRRAMRLGIADVVDQSAWWCRRWEAAFWPAESDPCLQVADYCNWAIQRKWEREDTRSYDLIKSKIRSEWDAFETGTTYYY